MSVIAPWHSALRQVHHNNTDCNVGNNIETENLRHGTGGKPLCAECARIAAEAFARNPYDRRPRQSY